jgi:hypothetical protein
MVGIWDIALLAGLFIYRQQILDFITKAGQSITPPAAPAAAQPPPAPSGPSTSPSPTAPAAPPTPPAKNQTGGTPITGTTPSGPLGGFTPSGPVGGTISPAPAPATPPAPTSHTPTTVSPQKESQTLKQLRKQRATSNVKGTKSKPPPDPCAEFKGQPSTYAACRKAHGLSVNIAYIDEFGNYLYDYDPEEVFPDYIPEGYEWYFLY